ncbi:Eco29kI family restriction endonuclease [Nevskia sp.]|uniref:Eco29kI family restriction endonuclease n=1 Tax=Nevskia sp. TaxID=1929292 RepID=UPI0025E67538|nr:Eco29kI family restriction endonuclease [Nevskia sp.]
MNAKVVPFNPLDKRNLADSIARTLIAQQARSFDELQSFSGAGLYAIYYSGDFPCYRRLAEANSGADPRWPIYVGKASTAGTRKGGLLGDTVSGKPLLGRLREHQESLIAASSTLKIEDFRCRSLVVDDLWIALGEALLISQYSPVWNQLLDGFGNHDPGKGRHEGLAPRWDLLHPGRAWAAKLRPRTETAGLVSAEIEQFLAALPLP